MKNPLQPLCRGFFACFETMGSDPDVSFWPLCSFFLQILKQWGLTPMFHFCFIFIKNKKLRFSFCVSLGLH